MPSRIFRDGRGSVVGGDERRRERGLELRQRHQLEVREQLLEGGPVHAVAAELHPVAQLRLAHHGVVGVGVGPQVAGHAEHRHRVAGVDRVRVGDVLPVQEVVLVGLLGVPRDREVLLALRVVDLTAVLRVLVDVLDRPARCGEHRAVAGAGGVRRRLEAGVCALRLVGATPPQRRAGHGRDRGRHGKRHQPAGAAVAARELGGLGVLTVGCDGAHDLLQELGPPGLERQHRDRFVSQLRDHWRSFRTSSGGLSEW